jgi:hypothetical protein
MLFDQMVKKSDKEITADFVTGDEDAATVETVDSSVPDTPMVNNNQGQSRFGHYYTVFVLCHGEYTCSHVTVRGLYRPRLKKSYVAFRNPTNFLSPKTTNKKHL